MIVKIRNKGAFLVRAPYFYRIAWRRRTKRVKRSSNKSSLSILAPSDLAWLGSGGSHKQAVVPMAIAAFAIVSIRAGNPRSRGGLVRLLQGMGYIHNDWETECLHLRDTPKSTTRSV